METYETFSTTADVGIRIRGQGYGGLFQSAVKGLNYLLFGEHGAQGAHGAAERKDGAGEIYSFDFTGDGGENVLVNLLAEILYLLQVQNKQVIDMAVKEVGETHVNADLFIVPLDMVPELEIKSVTYHNLEIKDENGIKTAEVIFDI
jgi:SHS2 domain-containing protein